MKIKLLMINFCKLINVALLIKLSSQNGDYLDIKVGRENAGSASIRPYNRCCKNREIIV